MTVMAAQPLPLWIADQVRNDVGVAAFHHCATFTMVVRIQQVLCMVVTWW